MVMSLVWVWAYFASKESPHDVVPGARFGRYAGQRESLAGFKEHQGQRNVFSVIRTLLSIRMFRQILVFSFLSHILRSFFMVWTPKFLVDIGMGTIAAAATSAIFPVLGCLGTIFLGWFTDHYAKDGDRARMMWIMLVGLSICFSIVALLVPFRLEYQYAIIFFLAAAGFCLFGPYSMSSGCLSLDIAGSEGAGTCTGMIDGVGYIGSALTIWGAGVISSRIGWTDVFWILAGCSVLAVASAYAMSSAYLRDVKQRKLAEAAGL